MTIQELLKQSVDNKFSDLHLIAGSAPMQRIEGRLTPLPGAGVLDSAVMQSMVGAILNAEQKETLARDKEMDLSIAVPGVARFRANIYTEKGSLAAEFRAVCENIPSIEELRLPKVCHTFSKLRQGFVLVTGPTGQGKSSTLASIIEEINTTRAEHIVTIEDPIEYVYKAKKSIISQREIGTDTGSWARALKSVLREDPDVVLIGEMRDPETMAAAITIAETGHLVFSTLHTGSAGQTIDRIIDSFPKEQQSQIRIQLSATLEAVLSQKLVPSKLDGKRVVATEMMAVTPAIRNVIREAKSHQIDNIIMTSAEMGMFLMESSLADLVNSGTVDFEVAKSYALRPTVLARLLGQ